MATADQTAEKAATTKIWANSGDSHLVEPMDLFDSLPQRLRDLMPRSVKDPSGEFETIYIDGQEFRRDMPNAGKKPATPTGFGARPEDSDPDELFTRILGGNDADHRIKDLDGEGVWAEVIYPSLGIWTFNIQTPEVVRAGCEVLNDWSLDFQSKSPRFVCAASIPLIDIDDAVAEVKRASNGGFKVGFLPVKPPIGRPDWHHEEWDPMWAAFAETGMVIGFHIGTEPHDPTQRTVLNYTETTYGGQRAVTQMIASGTLDRYPELKVLVSEGGATWGPFLADRMDEGYRQHGAGVRPKLSKLPSEFIYDQVYASFQHDSTAVKACTAMGWQNVIWGSDYPHFEGTFGHTQETLHGLFDGVDEAASLRMRVGAFQELFPHVPAPPTDGQELPSA
jgi:predicted TIM-barrel fold metal-dependent hydrolase